MLDITIMYLIFFVFVGGSSVNVTNCEGFTLLHCAILDSDTEGAIFLLNHGADIDMR